MTCYSQQQIADEVGVHKDTITENLKERRKLESFPKSDKPLALYQEPDWEPPLYAVDVVVLSFNSLEVLL